MIIIRNKSKELSLIFFSISFNLAKNVISEILRVLLIGQNDTLGVLRLVNFCIEYQKGRKGNHFSLDLEHFISIVFPLFLKVSWPEMICLLNWKKVSTRLQHFRHTTLGYPSSSSTCRIQPWSWSWSWSCGKG